MCRFEGGYGWFALSIVTGAAVNYDRGKTLKGFRPSAFRWVML